MLVLCLVFRRRQQYVGKVRFSHFDTHVQSSKKVLVATEKNVFAAINTRTGELCEYFVSLRDEILTAGILFTLLLLLYPSLLQSGDMWINLGQRETLMRFCSMDKVIYFSFTGIAVKLKYVLVLPLNRGDSSNCVCVPDAILVVGNGRLLRSWDVSVGGLNWEIVLDSGR